MVLDLAMEVIIYNYHVLNVTGLIKSIIIYGDIYFIFLNGL